MNTIKLLINRHWETIPTEDIIYITISDKLSYLHLKRRGIINLFVTLSEYEQLLPSTEFIRISRNCIVNYSSIYSIDNLQVHLLNGEHLSYSKRREKVLLDGYKEYIQCRLAHHPKTRTAAEDINFLEQFQSLNTLPIAFAVLELIQDEEGRSIDFIFRYANQALAQLNERPLEQVVENSFFHIFSNAQVKWLAPFSEVAFHGKQLEVVDYSPEVNKNLRIQCYQPYYGYCGCLFTDITSQVKSGGLLPPSIQVQKKYSQFFHTIEQLSPSQLEALERFIKELLPSS